MGYVSESMVEAYETRENQYPPYGKEVVDVNGTKFMRDIKDETNKNKEQTFEDFFVLEKKHPSGCDSTSSLSEEYSPDGVESHPDGYFFSNAMKSS